MVIPLSGKQYQNSTGTHQAVSPNGVRPIVLENFEVKGSTGIGQGTGEYASQNVLSDVRRQWLLRRNIVEHTLKSIKSYECPFSTRRRKRYLYTTAENNYQKKRKKRIGWRKLYENPINRIVSELLDLSLPK